MKEWNKLEPDLAIKSDLKWLFGLLVVAPSVGYVAYDKFCDYDKALTIHEKVYKNKVIAIKVRMDRDRQALVMLKNMKKQIIG